MADHTHTEQIPDHPVTVDSLIAEHAAELRKQVERLTVYRNAWERTERVLDKALGTEEHDGAGEGQAADVHLLMEQRDQARADLDRVFTALVRMVPHGWHATPTMWQLLDAAAADLDRSRAELEQQRARAERRLGERDEALTKLFEQGTKYRDEIAKLRAKLDTAYQLTGEEALIDMEPPIPPYGSPEREALRAALRSLRASLRGEQG